MLNDRETAGDGMRKPVMGNGAALWVLTTLVSIPVSGSHPWSALAMGGAGGLGIGVYLWQQARTRLAARGGFRPAKNVVVVLSPALVAMLLAIQVPAPFPISACVWLAVLWIGHKADTGRLLPGTPLELPVLILLVASLTSLLAFLNLGRSSSAVCMLLSGLALGHALVGALDT